jgi:antitoxin (DNA-binding transcriptional repressor) of toxin-antitoxin stability system
MIMAADHGSVKCHRKPTAKPLDAKSPGTGEADLPPGITVSELIARVGDLKAPGGGFADNLEAVQAEQGLAETTEWPDRADAGPPSVYGRAARSKAMKITDKLTEAALAERLDEVLDRASQGEAFAIERDGEVIAVIGPPTPSAQPGITWGEFVAKYRDLPRPDDRFADDLEAILAERNKMIDGTETSD